MWNKSKPLTAPLPTHVFLFQASYPSPQPLHSLCLALGLEEALPQMQAQKLPLLLRVL